MAAEFELPDDLMFNRGQIQDPDVYVKERAPASWLFLVGDEFAAMPGGISYEQVQNASPVHARVVSDPPRVMNLDLAKQHVAALDNLPRPTLISCRAGPRSSAVAYMYAGLKQNAAVDDVLAAADRDAAPFAANAELRDWVRDTLAALRAEG
jgi:hypothetical protein